MISPFRADLTPSFSPHRSLNWWLSSFCTAACTPSSMVSNTPKLAGLFSSGLTLENAGPTNDVRGRVATNHIDVFSEDMLVVDLFHPQHSDSICKLVGSQLRLGVDYSLEISVVSDLYIVSRAMRKGPWVIRRSLWSVWKMILPCKKWMGICLARELLAFVRSRPFSLRSSSIVIWKLVA